MINYAPATPRGKDGLPKYDTYGPAKVAIASRNIEGTAASSIMLLNNQTTELELTPTTTTAFKWLSQAVIDSSVAGTSVITAQALGPNYDFVVPGSVTRRVVVPAVSNGNETSIAAARDLYGLAAGLATKTIVTTGSVLTVQL